ITGEARVLAPTEKISRPRIVLPSFRVFDPEVRLQAFLESARPAKPVLCGVVHPCEEQSLRAVLRATELGLIEPVIFAPEARLHALVEQFGISLQGLRIETVAHSHAAAERAAEWAAQQVLNQVPAMLLKGSLHTDEMMHALLATPGLRTKRRASHVFRLDAPMYAKPLLISDAALNIQPSLEEKADIVQNAIDAAQALGVERPKVALLAAVETVTSKMVATLDAAALCKMADRGQITGGVLDGPLAFDNSISMEAVRIKGIISPVAGDADVLIVPDLESGNMLAKQLEYLGGAASCGVVLGLRVPVALTSRADGVASRVASVAFALRLAAHYARHQP
ncbi:MAG: bifunctional enoyl-CoA hydratase/phosphate acetyltransferase, partial [Pseudomonadota bacterium]